MTDLIVLGFDQKHTADALQALTDIGSTDDTVRQHGQTLQPGTSPQPGRSR